MTTIIYQGRKYKDGTTSQVNDNLTIEEALQVTINEKTFTITMRSPGDDDDLIRGLLYSEDIYRSTDSLKIDFNTDQKKSLTEAKIRLDEGLLGSGYLNSRNVLSVSSCGICGKTELEDLTHVSRLSDSNKLNIKGLNKMFEIMNKHQQTFLQSGGSHASAAFTINNELLTIKEDIGRHNAVDKVIGNLINSNNLSKANCLLVSGRVSYEIISKAFSAKIPILAAVSAPSSLAVDFAKELGITLLGFCRENKATCYSHPYRLIN